MTSLKKFPLDRKLKAVGAQNLNNEEAFLWSRIESAMSVNDLLKISPFDQDKTSQILESLIEKKAVSWCEPLSSAVNEWVEHHKMELEKDRGTEAESLDLALRAEILDRLQKLPDQNPFETLNTLWNASEHQIKNQYLQLSRRFHPDRFFRKKMGPYKRRLDQLFTGIQKAYEKLKNEHDREALRRQFRPRTNSESIKSTDIAKKRMDPLLERLGKAEHHFKLGQECEKKGDFEMAAAQYHSAMKLNPERKEYQKAHSAILNQVNRSKAQKYLDQARAAADNQKHLEAVKAARAAIRADEDNPEARWILGRSLLELGEDTDLQEAKEQLLRAKAKLISDPRPCIWLAKIFMSQRDKAKAKDELQEALRRDPTNQAATNLLKKL